MPAGATQFQYQGRALPVYFAPETVTADRWLPTLTQPLRKAFAVALLTSGAAAPVFTPAFPHDGLVPTFAQPDRRPRYARLYKAEVLTTAAEAVTAERTPPVWVQPSRAVRYAAGTSAVLPVLPQRNLLFREALAAQLLLETGVTGLVAGRVFDGYVSQGNSSPALTFQVISKAAKKQRLDGPTTLVPYRVQFTAHSRDPGECQDVIEAVRQWAEGFTGSLGRSAVTVVETWFDDESDRFDPPGDGTQQQLARESCDVFFRVREPRPTRLP